MNAADLENDSDPDGRAAGPIVWLRIEPVDPSAAPAASLVSRSSKWLRSPMSGQL